MAVSNLDTAPSYYRHLQTTSGAKIRQAVPNLYGVGPGRSGTSFLYGLLAGHDDILVSPVKETNYFGILQEGYRRGGLTMKDYSRLFAHPVETEYAYIAEVTPVYLFAPGALNEIKNASGYPKLIVTLREPIDRAHSQYKHHRQHHENQSFDEYVELGLEQLNVGANKKGRWFEPGTNLRQSLYAADIGRAWQLFGRERVQILFYEELKHDPDAWIKRLARFLEVEFDISERQADRYRNASPAGEIELSEKNRAKLLKIYGEDRGKLDNMSLDVSIWDS
jgi:hypothetical protein